MRLMAVATIGFVLMCVLIREGYQAVQKTREREWRESHPFDWQQYASLDGYFNGVQALVPLIEYEPQNRYNRSEPIDAISAAKQSPLLTPVVYNPYPDYQSTEYLQNHPAVQDCLLDAQDAVPARDVYAYPGIPQHFPQPFCGSHHELALTESMCFDRFGRLGPYGLDMNDAGGENQKTLYTQNIYAEQAFDQRYFGNYTNTDWGAAQSRCLKKNQGRFTGANGKIRIPRHAYILRSWTGYEYDEHQIYTMRAMINELALKSGGEYDVHLLVHVKNDSVPIWTEERSYTETLQRNVPKEFWNITTLWSEQQMKMYYPGPFQNNFASMDESTVHGVYRSAHFALQWFSQQHPEYDFFWNWEMDIRYSGHYYDFNSKVGEWAKKQPRKGLWERNRRFWLPEHHGSFQQFTQFVDEETSATDKPKNDLEINGPLPIWGPLHNLPNVGTLAPLTNTTPPRTYNKDKHHWGAGEEADLIVFNPIFDPARTNWVFRKDITGYNTTLPIPPRRSAIITAARFSKRLLNRMHEEVSLHQHTMFTEMFAPTICLHYGLKAVYVPHPLYFDRDWDLAHMDQVLNYPKFERESPFGWGEHNLLRSSFYYNSKFAPKVWRRWLGQWENGREEVKWESGSGRMCLPGILFHPVKFETEWRV